MPHPAGAVSEAVILPQYSTGLEANLVVVREESSELSIGKKRLSFNVIVQFCILQRVKLLRVCACCIRSTV